MKKMEEDTETYSKKVAFSKSYSTNAHSSKELGRDMILSLDLGEL